MIDKQCKLTLANAVAISIVRGKVVDKLLDLINMVFFLYQVQKISAYV